MWTIGSRPQPRNEFWQAVGCFVIRASYLYSDSKVRPRLWQWTVSRLIDRHSGHNRLRGLDGFWIPAR